MIQDILEILQQAYNNNWITARDGNISYKLEDKNQYLITPSGFRKQELKENQFVKIKITDDGWEQMTNQNLKPSGEIELHHGLLKDYSDNRCVVHLHPTYTVAALYAGIDISKLVLEFPELGRYTRVAPSVGVVEPISQELADRCLENLNIDENGECEYDIVAIDKHGVVAIDSDPWKAFEHIERLEHICRIVLSSNITSNKD